MSWILVSRSSEVVEILAVMVHIGHGTTNLYLKRSVMDSRDQIRNQRRRLDND
jgi:hypothetical protein